MIADSHARLRGPGEPAPTPSSRRGRSWPSSVAVPTAPATWPRPSLSYRTTKPAAV